MYEKHEQTLGTLHVGQQSKDVVGIYLFLTASASAIVHVPQPEHNIIYVIINE